MSVANDRCKFRAMAGAFGDDTSSYYQVRAPSCSPVRVSLTRVFTAARQICRLERSLFLFGGLDDNGCQESQDTLRRDDRHELRVLQLNLNDSPREWGAVRMTGSVPSGRIAHSCTVADELVYLYGGKHDDFVLSQTQGTAVNSFEIMDDFFIFNPQSRQWRALQASGRGPGRRAYATLSTAGRRLILIGGYDQSHDLVVNQSHGTAEGESADSRAQARMQRPETPICVYDLDSNAWSTPAFNGPHGHLEQLHGHAAAAVVHPRLLLDGVGGAGDGKENTKDGGSTQAAAAALGDPAGTTGGATSAGAPDEVTLIVVFGGRHQGVSTRKLHVIDTSTTPMSVVVPKITYTSTKGRTETTSDRLSARCQPAMCVLHGWKEEPAAAVGVGGGADSGGGIRGAVLGEGERVGSLLIIGGYAGKSSWKSDAIELRLSVKGGARTHSQLFAQKASVCLSLRILNF